MEPMPIYRHIVGCYSGLILKRKQFWVQSIDQRAVCLSSESCLGYDREYVRA